MITTVEELYDHVNRHSGIARLGDLDGTLHIFGSGQVALHKEEQPGGRRVNIEENDLADLEIRTMGPDGVFVALTGFDETEVDRVIARLNARSSFGHRLDEARRAIESLRAVFPGLHPDDSEVGAAAYGATDQVALPLADDLEWPEF
jgi:hypothetical protein